MQGHKGTRKQEKHGKGVHITPPPRHPSIIRKLQYSNSIHVPRPDPPHTATPPQTERKDPHPTSLIHNPLPTPSIPRTLSILPSLCSNISNRLRFSRSLVSNTATLSSSLALAFLSWATISFASVNNCADNSSISSLV